MKQSDDLGLFNALIAAAAASGNVAIVPDTQATAGDGSASIALGFPPETFIDRAAGGSPPRGADMNGFLHRLSRAIQVLQAGYVGPFNAAFAQAIGGYPAGAIVSGATPGSFWVSTADSNITTPGANGATWKSLFDGYLTAAIAANTYVKKSGDTMSGILNNSSWVAGGVGGGWNNNSPAIGEIVFTNGIEFGNPADNGDFRGTWSVTDVHGNGAADQSGLNLTGYDATGVTYQWYFSWNGNITTPKGLVAFQSDVTAEASARNTAITNEAEARTDADTNLQTQIDGKQAAGNYVLADVPGAIIETFTATVSGNNQTIQLPREYSKTIFVAAQNGTDGNGFGMTNVVSWTESTALVSVASYHTGAPQSATITQTFIVIAVP
ncbi:hypothetical protein QQM41_11925 [Acetobacter sp. AC2005]|uniref:Tail fiber protein n=1 Tax=Acetobacter pasteurianus subsp. pasteurianus TaxID=481145 RepID=A0A1Y0Y0G2_ACEPA|nr:hypothetical protein [Acetobacter pasteurianus]ARW47872.1 hypothetical protein S1001342_01546 [Acetobacter pasteurianus subsp. pasteurianus]